MCRLLGCFTLLLSAGPAFACINDMELPAHEREFRSQYRGQADAPSPPSPPPAETPSHRLLLGTGAAMLTGAVALVLTARERK
jgi:hypothetical protein